MDPIQWQTLLNIGVLAAGAYWVKKTLRSEVHEGVLLSLDNGAGKKVEKLVAQGITAAFLQHTIQCPLRSEMEDLRRRLREIEHDRLGAS